MGEVYFKHRELLEQRFIKLHLHGDSGENKELHWEEKAHIVTLIENRL